MRNRVRRPSTQQPEHRDGFPELFPSIRWPRIAHLYGFSERELYVLRLLCRGLDNAAIARECRIRIPTVRTHLRSIYRKLHARDRLHAVLRLVHSGDKDGANHLSG